MKRKWFDAARIRGYTVIEVMIVLAVTGALFVSAAVLINGRQQRTQFEQAIREVHSQIQQVISETRNGYFPSSGNFNCTVTGGGPPQFSAVGAGQGTNEGCIFLGKAIQFDVEGTDPEEFRVITIAGRQQNTSGQSVANLDEAQPRVATGASTNGPLLYGLSTDSADRGVVAFVSSLSEVEDPDASRVGQLNLIPVDSTVTDMSEEAAAQAVNDNLASSPLNPDDGVRVCFVSGGTDQSGLITIGATGRGLGVTLDIWSDRSCGE